MSNPIACPQCTLENTYPDGANFVCADCGYEWPRRLPRWKKKPMR